MEVFTIGFTRRSAQELFDPIREAEVGRVVDVRLHNTSNLAGLARRAHLPYLLREICGAEYVHEPLLAPSNELFDGRKKRGLAWDVYERGFLELMAERQIERRIDRALLFGLPTALLCACARADRCHRRLVLEYLEPLWGPFEVTHL